MSDYLKLNKEDGKKILNGLLVAIIGAMLTYLADLIPNVDFGAYTPIVVALVSTGVNAIRKFLSDRDGFLLGIGNKV